MSKKLTLTQLRKMNKEIYNKTKTEEITSVDGEVYKVEVRQEFKPTEIEEVIHKFQGRVLECEQNGTEVDNSVWISYLMFLIFEKFTDILKGVNTKDDFSTELEVVELLINGGFYEELIKVIPEDQIKKVTGILGDTSKFLNAIVEEELRIQQENQEMNIDGKIIQ